MSVNPCAECASEGRRGYCAPLRCYCAHDTCHARESYVELRAPDLDSISDATSTTWASREGSTWIDRM